MSREKFVVKQETPTDSGLNPAIREKADDHLTQFGIRHFLLMTVSFAVFLAMIPYYSPVAQLLVVLNVGFWSGYSMIAISDFLDPGEIDERGILSKCFSSMGILLIAICGTIGTIVIALLLLGFVLQAF